MAKKTVTKRAAVTPITKGARSNKPLTAPPRFPFKIPPVRPDADEESLYSQPSEVADSKSNRTRRTDAALKAAKARMRGVTEEELDALGEANVVEEVDPQDDDDDDDDDGSDDGSNGADGDDGDDDGGETDLEGVATDEEREAMLKGTDIGAAAQTTSKPLDPQALRAEFERLVTEEVNKRLSNIGGAAPRSELPANPMQPAPSFLAATRVSYEDVDRLWDWIRRDPSASQAFFGKVPATTRQLHLMFGAINDAEQTGVALIRSIYIEGGPVPTHIGFAMIAPIMSEDRLALLHIYLETSMRGRLHQLLPPLMQLAENELPGYHFAVYPANDAQRRLYGQLLPSLGFTGHTLFVR